MKDKKPVGKILMVVDSISQRNRLNELNQPEGLGGSMAIHKAFPDLTKPRSADVQKSWGKPLVIPQGSEYLSGLQQMYFIPDTIEDEMPPVSQAFADKVKAMGGIMTPYGLICDPAAVVTGKRYMRLAKAVFCILYSQGDRHVEDVEFRIRNFAQRDKQGADWMGMNAELANRLRLAIMNRHSPGLRKPIYASTVTVPSSDLIFLEKADFSLDPTLKE